MDKTINGRKGLKKLITLPVHLANLDSSHFFPATEMDLGEDADQEIQAAHGAEAETVSQAGDLPGEVRKCHPCPILGLHTVSRQIVNQANFFGNLQIW